MIFKKWLMTSSCCRYIIALPKMTPDLDRVILLGYFMKDLAEDYEIWHSVKFMLMVTEMRLIEDYNLRDIFIIDMKNITFDKLKHYTLTVVKKIEECFLVILTL